MRFPHAALLLLLAGFAAAASAQNEIVVENQKPGRPASEWDVAGAGDASIQGFATDISRDLGETVELKVATDATDYRIDIYRLGWYGGDGARFIETIEPSAALPQSQPACLTEPASGLVDCGNWAVSASWTVPADAVSGIYLAKLVREDPVDGRASHVIFIVRDDDGDSALLFQTMDTTWQAYNQYGGNSLYVGGPGPGRAYKVSYNRPFTTRGPNPEDWVFNAEYPMLRWLERNGFDVSYTTGVDSERRGAEILEHDVFLSVAHDEYWSAGQRANVEAARGAGVHLAFFSGNEVFWKTRWESSIDGSGTPHRTLVSFKETHAGAKIDPLPGVWTGTWRDPRAFNPEGPQPENALTGTIFTVNCCSYPLTVPAEDGKLRFWRDTSVATLLPGQTATLGPETLGYEWDEDLDNGARPPGLVRLSTTTVAVPQRVLDHGSSYGPGVATHHMTLYRHASGALVFGAGTIQWPWGLDDQHDRGSAPADPRMQQATLNLLADMGALPGTLQAGLVLPAPSADATPPSTAITSPLPGASVAGTVLVTGTAGDTGGGVVGAVEVSSDGGATWHPASGRESWSFAFTPAASGPVTLRARAADDSGNLESPGASITIDVETASCPCSLWDDGVTPGGDPNLTDGQPIELGVKLRADTDGRIAALRFYKGSANGGTHVGHLWAADGTPLAEATFTGETASGWQQVALEPPVAVSAGTTYVASYHSPTGTYAADDSYFATSFDRPPLRALADGEDGPNGVYKYGASGFPTQTFQGSNYWVDVVFEPQPGEFSAWDETATPAQEAVTDGQPIEVGVKLQASVPGSVIGLRFYKGTANTGAHVAHLWSGGGALLASATFTDETASGWQEVSFAAPVPLAPDTTYVASYHSASGYFGLDAGYFASERVSGPLRLLADGADGPNGVFRYGASAFPDQDGDEANYWVDVVFAPDAPFDGDPPGVQAVTPLAAATGVAFGANVTARFDEAMDASSVTGASFELRDGGGTLVAASVGYAAATRTATLDPSADLAASTSYTATVKTGVTDAAGNALPADFVWSFTTDAPPLPPPDEGPGGPILVVAAATNPFGRYVAEILRTEGLNAFSVTDVSNVNAGLLAAHEVVVLGELPLDAAQAALFAAYVDGGGQLIALRPDADLAGLLGLTSAPGTLSDAYLQIDTGAPPGAGLVSETIQFHGTADLYTPAGASVLATLYQDATTATAHPAVTLHSVGGNGGRAAAFTYDLARSIVYTRQGNPAFAAQERDGFPPIRSDDLFYPDWIDLDKVAIPQADEQQRLLANLIQLLSEPPLPRFWYFPSGHEAVVVMTADQHSCCGGTRDRFDANLADDPPGCSVEDWECVRSSSYVYPGGGMNDVEGLLYHAQGFELGVHVNTGCADWTPATLDAFFASQLAAFAAQFPSLPQMDSHRTHCIAWSDWASEAEVEQAHGVRLDTNYYYWPPGWVQDRPGLFTGSGMPMRFARQDGSMIDVYQAATQMTDESDQSYPFTIDTLLDRAIGPLGYYGAFTANMHTDGASVSVDGNLAIVASAQARGVPVVSGRQLLEWLDGRNASTWSGLTWDGSTLTFSIAQAPAARNLRALLPVDPEAGPLTSLTRDAQPVAFTTEVIKGVSYAMFDAQSGSYVASYAPDALPPLITGISALPAADGSATVSWSTSEAASSRVDYGTEPGALGASATAPGFVTTHAVALTGLLPGTTYHYRVTSADAFSNAATEPAAPAPPLSFTTPTAACFADTSTADFALGVPDAGAVVADASGGELILAPALASEFDGASLPAGWSATTWAGGGTALVGGGALTLDGARAGTDATFGPGRSLELSATFQATPFQHAGFGVSYDGAPWAMFSTGATGTALFARSHDGATATDTPLGAGLLGAPHRFRIAWGAAAVDYFVDDALVASHPMTIAGPLRPLASDLAVGGPILVLDWLRLSPYAAAGSFLSRVADAGMPSSWGAVSFTRQLPAATGASVLARSGPTPAPDGFWSAFAPIPTSGSALGQTGRYAQYRLDLATADPDASPAVLDVTLACTPAPAHDSDGDGIPDVAETGTGVYVSPADTGSDPLDPDSDADGFDDGVEVAAGSDPNDPAAFPAPGGGARVLALGELPGGASPSRALAVTPDGLAVAGLTTTLAGVEAFRWSVASGMQPLGDLAGGAVDGAANGISANGATLVGGSASGAGPEAFRWTAAGGSVGLGDLAGGTFASEALDVSAGGAVVVGAAVSASGPQAFRWTQAGGLVGLGDLAGGAFASEARGVSADGAVVVGAGTSGSGPQGFRWTASGMTALGELPGGAFASAANDVSANGATSVGFGTNASGRLAFRRVEPLALRPLGELSGGAYGSEALAVSGDGSIVVGTSEGPAGPEAFVWSAATGVRSLARLLEDDLGLDLSSWERLVAAEDISDDGRTIVGYVLRGGAEHAFVAYADSACNDGLDGDFDGLADAADPGCASVLDASELADCADGLDNDGDGLVDFGADPSCANAGEASREWTQCSNGLDDDGNGNTDLTGCTGPSDADESAPPVGGGCGLGPELVPLLVAFAALRRRKLRLGTFIE